MDFETFLKENSGLIYLQLQKVKRDSRFKYTDPNDIICMIQHAAWLAWKDYTKDSKGYQFGTFLDNRVKNAKKIYRDLHTTNQPTIEINYDIPIWSSLENDEYLNHLLSKLSDKEQNIIQNRYIKKMTLQECAKESNLSIEGARIVEKRALNKMQYIVNSENIDG